MTEIDLAIDAFAQNVEKLIFLLPYADVISSVPSVSGIYFLVNTETGELVYVGRSVNIRKRWQSRRDFSIGGSYRLYFWKQDYDIDIKEALLIAALRPLHNRQISSCWVSRAERRFGGRHG